jgi:hypothetical protein
MTGASLGKFMAKHGDDAYRALDLLLGDAGAEWAHNLLSADTGPF